MRGIEILIRASCKRDWIAKSQLFTRHFRSATLLAGLGFGISKITTFINI